MLILLEYHFVADEDATVMVKSCSEVKSIIDQGVMGMFSSRSIFLKGDSFLFPILIFFYFVFVLFVFKNK